MPLSFPGGLWVPIFSGSFSGVTKAEFKNLGTFRKLRFSIESMTCAGATGNPALQTSTNNGSSYDGGASDYGYMAIYGHTTLILGFTSTGDVSLQLPCDTIDTSGEGWCNCELQAFNQSQDMQFLGTGGFLVSSVLNTETISGRRLDGTARNAFQIIAAGSTTFSIQNMMLEGVQG